MKISLKNTLRRLPALCALCAICFYSCKTHFKTNSQHYTAVSNASSLERGKNLAYNVCGGCHYNHALNKFVGQRLHDLPKFMGKVYSANLTNSTGYGVLHNYSDAQLAYLIKTGIKPDGRFIPYMIRPTMADADVNDIIVYLRSGDAPVSAGDTSVGKTHLSLMGRLAMHFQKPQPFKQGIKRPASGDAVANGRYLVDILSCYHCHSKSILSLNYQNPEDSKGYMQGGMKFKNKNGVKIHAANLTPDKETGIGKYSEGDFSKAVREGITLEGRPLNFPMPQFHDLTDKQVSDIYAYLRTLPAKE